MGKLYNYEKSLPANLCARVEPCSHVAQWTTCHPFLELQRISWARSERVSNSARSKNHENSLISYIHMSPSSDSYLPSWTTHLAALTTNVSSQHRSKNFDQTVSIHDSRIAISSTAEHLLASEASGGVAVKDHRREAESCMRTIPLHPQERKRHRHVIRG